MESTIEKDQNNPTPPSLRDARQHFQDLFTASSKSDAWSSFKKMIDALPAWALVVGIVSVVTLLANVWVIPVVFSVGIGMAAVYFTVKHAVREALREHDRRSH